MDLLQRFLDAIANAIEGLMDACRFALDFVVRLFQVLLNGLRRIVIQLAKLLFYAGPFAGLLFAGLDLRSSVLYWMGVITLSLPIIAAVANVLSNVVAALRRAPRTERKPRDVGDKKILENVTIALNALTLMFFLDWYFQGRYGIALWNQLVALIGQWRVHGVGALSR